jgi:hypothetical protein
VLIVCSVVALIVLVVFALGPAKGTPRSGLGFEFFQGPNSLRITSQVLPAAVSFSQNLTSGARSSSATAMMYRFDLPIPGNCLNSTMGSRSPINEANRVSLSR